MMRAFVPAFAAACWSAESWADWACLRIRVPSPRAKMIALVT